MIPLRDVIPTRTTPLVSRLLIAAQIALTLEAAWQRGWIAVPMAASLLLIWLFGSTVEDRMGHGRFLAFVTLCLLAGTLAASAGAGLTRAAAGHAAAGGLAAGYLLLYPQSRVVTLVPMFGAIPIVEVPAFVFPVCWLLLQTGSAVPGGALAGIAVGAATVRLFRRAERMRVEWWNG